jgi:hypothetical protein
MTNHPWKLTVAAVVFTALSIVPYYGQTFRTLSNFSGPNGQEPNTMLVQGTDGKFYGETSKGGNLA